MGGDSERGNKPAPAVQVTQNIGHMSGGTATAYVNGPLHIGGVGPAAPPAPGGPTAPTAPPTASVAPVPAPAAPSLSPGSAAARPARAGNEEALFSWLHLSDIHVGHGDRAHQLNQTRVLAAIARDIEDGRERGECPAPDAIFVTGDLALSGQPDQYAQAKKWLSQVAATVGLDLTRVLAVPGNHDVDRAADKDVVTGMVVGAVRRGLRTLDDVLHDAPARAILAKRMAAYSAFARDLGPAPGEEPLFWEHSEVVRGTKVRVVGLNTALLAAGADDKGLLALGESQLQLVRSARDELTIMLSHHPFSWLSDGVVAAAQVAQSADIHLSGHVHEAESMSQWGGGGTGILRVVAGAAHDEKPQSGPPGGHGYNWASVVRTADGRVVLRVWPWRWTHSQDFRLDVVNVPKGKSFAEHPLPRLRLSSAAAAPLVSSASPPAAPTSPFAAPAPSSAAPSPSLASRVSPAAPPPVPAASSPAIPASLHVVAAATTAGAAPVSGASSPPTPSISAPTGSEGQPGDAPLVVILAADADHKLRDELAVLLRPAVDAGFLHVWHFGHIRPGDTRETVIQRHLARAAVVVVMTTATFLASNADVARLSAVMERQRKEGLRVIPVLAGPCLWKVTALRTLEMLPADGQSVATSTHRAVVLQQIGEAILDAALALSETAGLPRPERPAEGPKAMFERVVRERSPLVDMGLLRAFLKRAERQVCRIEDDTGSALGTGFLVGPDKLLTNHHVVERYLSLDDGGSMLQARFDYVADDQAAAIPVGRLHTFADPFCLASSPVSPNEFSEIEPSPTELDFALLALKGRPGEEEVGGVQRGWLDMASSVALPQPNDVVFVFQHPEGRPMQAAIDVVQSVNANGTRVRYVATTGSGSSGSPCFDLHRRLVALHHGSNGTYNQGIAATALWDYFKAQGLDKLVGR